MSIAIIGFGAVGQALAKAFARKEIGVAVASRRPPEALADAARAIGPAVTPKALGDALQADTILLAVPFTRHEEIAKEAEDWTGKLIVDATNAYGVPLEQFGGLTSSAFLARAFPGANLVKGFNHLPAAKLAADPDVNGGRRVIFVAGDHEEPLAAVSSLATRLGYAPVSLGSLAEGAVLTQSRGSSWSPLNFQDLVKFDAR